VVAEDCIQCIFRNETWKVVLSSGSVTNKTEQTNSVALVRERTIPTIYKSLGVTCRNATIKNFYRYRNTRSKLYSCDTDIFFNQECVRENLVPNYINTKLLNNTKISNKTYIEIQVVRIKDEIEFLCIKKSKPKIPM
jgi:hypothetical protein